MLDPDLFRDRTGASGKYGLLQSLRVAVSLLLRHFEDALDGQHIHFSQASHRRPQL